METTTASEIAQVKVESSTDASDNSFKENQPYNQNWRGRGRGGYRGGKSGRPLSYMEENYNQGFRSRCTQNYDNQSQDGSASTEGLICRNHHRGPDEKFNERAAMLSGHTYDLPSSDMTEIKFNGRNRLYIGNIGCGEITKKDLEDLFKKYGECSEAFINKEKNFAFIKLDYHCNAEKAKKELDGTIFKSRNLKIRFAPNSASVKIKNLTPVVTNELLLYAFSIFGEVEKAVICVDERGKPTGEGIIDFSRKGSALAAIRKCTDSCFFLTTSLRPCIVEGYEAANTTDGYSEKGIHKKNMEYQKERQQGPRFAIRGSFEEEYGIRWKKLYDLHAQKEEALKKELNLEIAKLAAQMEYARYEHETEVLRNRLKAREKDKEKQKREWEMKQKLVEQERLRAEEVMRRSTEEMDMWILKQKEEANRRQEEKSLFIQAQNLDSILDYKQTAYGGPGFEYGGRHEDRSINESSLFLNSYDRQSTARYPAQNGGVWVTDSSRQKKRRY